uniref:Gnk2-homologous domain-containing protein n=1 Tax=Cucumis sativus TaxID=3659 RepID=A0A0A0LS37_CUCSA
MLIFPTFFIICFIIHGNSQTADQYPYRSCSSANFTQSSTYHSILNLLLSNLSAHAPGTNGFFNTSIARPPNDAVYGLFQCRGDVTNTTCRNCVTSATKNSAEQFCPLSQGAVVWYDECIFRYSSHSFFSVISLRPGLLAHNEADIGIDTARFNQLVMSTLRHTAASASSVDELFAKQHTYFTSDITLYTLAQCTRDLSYLDCQQCLAQSIDYVPNCCANKRGARVLFPSCFVRYEIYNFYEFTSNNSVQTPPPSLPSSPPGENKVSRVSIVAIVVPIAITVSIILVAVGWWFLHRRAKKKYSPVKEDSVIDEMSTAESLQFDFKTINDATNNFSEENRLGEGGFGAVYKGRLENGQEIAVKRLSRGSSQDVAEDIMTHAWKLWTDGTSLTLLDASLRESYSKRQALRCIHIALLCVQHDPLCRPSMASIVLMLSSHSTSLPLPKEPAFSMRSKDGGIVIESDRSTRKSDHSSTNEISMSELCPR